MATGYLRQLSPSAKVLVDLSGSRTTGDGTYILDVSSSPINHYNQIHIHQYGRMIEMNILTTLNGPMSVGTFYTFATTPLKPIYTIRAEGYGAQSTSDYAVQEGIVSINTQGQLNFTPYSAVASGGQCTFRFNIVYILAEEIQIGGAGSIATTPTDQLAARVAALEDKCTMKVLVNIQSENTLDGVYFYGKTPRFPTVTQERVTQYGDIISFRLYGTLKAVNDSGTNEAWSALGNSLKTLCTTSLIPAFPYRFPVFSSNDQGTIIGVLTIEASNGNISFEPTVRITSSGTRFTTLPAGSTMGFMVHGTYPLTAIE